MNPIRAVIFDLDGVIVSTDECHFQGWLRLAREEGIPFDRANNERLRGVSRMESLAILLERSPRAYTDAEKLALAERKNGYYRELIRLLTPADRLPGVTALLAALEARGVKTAIASSSKNAGPILGLIGMNPRGKSEGGPDAPAAGFTFDAVVTGHDIARTKPDPEIFRLAAQRCGVSPEESLVVEDAAAGVEGAIAAGMRVLAVGFAATDPACQRRATACREGLEGLSADDLLALAVKFQ